MDWVRIDGRLDVEVRVPVGATAQVTLPTPDGRASLEPQQIEPGVHRFSVLFRDPQDEAPDPTTSRLPSPPQRPPAKAPS